MTFEETPIPGAWLVGLERRGDERGFFARLFCADEFAELGLAATFVQVNDSLSMERGTLRGMHYQLPPAAEVKLVRCVREIADLVQGLLPEAEIVYTGETGEDPRSYRASFDLLGELAPGFRLEYTLAAGMEELLRRLAQHSFSQADWEGPRFVRLRTLRGRLALLGAPAIA